MHRGPLGGPFNPHGRRRARPPVNWPMPRVRRIQALVCQLSTGSPSTIRGGSGIRNRSDRAWTNGSYIPRSSPADLGVAAVGQLQAGRAEELAQGA